MRKVLVTAGLAYLSGACTLAPAALVVEQVGDGTHKLNSDALPVVLALYSTNGALMGTNPLPLQNPRPTTGQFNLLEGGSSASDGQLTRSVNGLYIQVPGYNATNKQPSITSSLSTEVLRTIGLMGVSGVDTSRAFNMLTGSNFRSVVSVDGSAFWAAGQSGMCYVRGNTVVPLCGDNIRCLNIFFGQLFCTKGGSLPGIYSLGSGLPTNGVVDPQPYLLVPGVSNSPFAFQMNTAGNICYVADERDGYGIMKFSLVSGNWVSNYTLGTGWINGARGLAVDWSRPGVPIVYATTTEASANRLIRIVDTGAGSSATDLAFAAAKMVFRGVDFLPMPAVWRPCASGNWSAGGTRQWSNWNVGVANGTHILLQNVNTNAGPLNVNLTNNTTLARISSLTFSDDGYGKGPGTSYTLYGNGLSVSNGIFHQSPVSQTIKMPLGFAADQVISNEATLTLDGRISGNTGITKTGGGSLVLNATNQFIGSLAVQSGILAVNGVLTNSTLTVFNGLLQGTGRISGPVTIVGGATLKPGGDATGGNLVVDGSLALNGHLITRISKNGTNCVSSTVTGVKQLSLAGYLDVQLSLGTLAAGDVFRVFSASSCSGEFWGGVQLPALSPGLYWDKSNLISAGILTVREIPPPQIRSLQLVGSDVSFSIYGGPPGTRYEVWATSDLSDPGSWYFVSSGDFDQTGYARVLEQYVDATWRRFYRVLIR